MSLQNDERTITILRIIAEGTLGTDKTGQFAKLDDIIEEMGDKQTTKDIIDGFLLPSSYIRKINDKFKSVTGNDLEYKAYQITEHGKTLLSKNQISHQPITYHQNNFGNVYGSNIAIESQYVSQVIEKQDNDTKKLLEDLLEATSKKDKSAILKTLGYIGDKSLELLIAIIAGGLKL